MTRTLTRSRRQRLLLAFAAALAPAFACVAADGPAGLLEARFHGDRTGACVVAATIAHDAVVRARYCARSAGDPPPGDDDAFEIGSVTKTMTAYLVADLVDQGKWSLDDPIAAHLPADTVVPSQAERQILVRDLLTHRSGLPPLPVPMPRGDPADPYAALTEADLLRALARTPLTRPIGSASEYSNFGMMVLSLAVARAEGGDLERALRTRLFAPLHMDRAGIAWPSPATHRVVGHLPTGASTAPWTAEVNLAGVGMVHASLDDMVRYARAELGDAPPDIASRMRRTQSALAPGIAMNWQLASLDGRQFVLHEGGTGGFSSIVLLEPSQHRAVVILSDTALTDLGGLGALAMAMIGTRTPPGAPRVAVPIPAELRAAIQGTFDVGGIELTIRDQDGHLRAQAPGQPSFELFHDSHGDLYPAVTSALLTPEPENGRIDRFAWHQGGGIVEARRTAGSAGDAKPANVDPRWKDWLGDYALAPQFGLHVFQDGSRLKVRATGQAALEATVAGPDLAEIAGVAALLKFQRDKDGAVIGVTLVQNGHELAGKRQ